MANGANGQPWFPASDVEAAKAARGEVYQGKDGNFYQHENIKKATPKNPPEVVPPSPAEAPQTSAKAEEPAPKAAPAPHLQSTPPATSESGPSSEDLDAVAAEEALKHATAAPPSLAGPSSVMKPTPGGPIDPSYDADKYDSTGKNVKQEAIPGPRGADRPADVMSEEERAAIAQKREDRLAKGMSSTHSIDSSGKPKGEFATVSQGNDKHGARLPDKINYSKPVTPVAPHVGPRGVGAPKDTFHKK